jgi:glycosyltransferase involved in cell wall biosynthesis
MNEDVTVLVCGESGLATDAIQQYAGALCTAMNACGDQCAVEILPRNERGSLRWNATDGLIRSRASVFVIQYNPFSYGRLGVTLPLVVGVARLRRTKRDARIVLMCHETVTMAPGVRWCAIRQLHRVQLAFLLALSHSAFVSVGAWIPTLRALGARGARRLPVGSNMPDRRADRVAVRASLSMESAFVVTSFSTGHPSHRDDYLVSAIEAVLKERPDAVVVTLGAGRQPVMTRHPSVLEVVPGLLEARDVAGLLAASDLFISPYVDGASTRRGTIMAALQHGVAVASTIGNSTDTDLASHLKIQDIDGTDTLKCLRATASALARDDVARAAHGSAGRALYESSYDWDVIARELTRTTA